MPVIAVSKDVFHVVRIGTYGDLTILTPGLGSVPCGIITWSQCTRGMVVVCGLGVKFFKSTNGKDKQGFFGALSKGWEEVEIRLFMPPFSSSDSVSWLDFLVFASFFLS